MDGAIDTSRHALEQVRLGFYREYRPQAGFSSVAVQRDGDRGDWFIAVGATGPVKVPQRYGGFPVRVAKAPGAINAVARLDQVS